MTTSSGILSRFQSESSIRIIQFLVGAIAIGIIFWQLQFSTSAICCGDFDGYYHIKWTRNALGIDEEPERFRRRFRGCRSLR